MSVLIKGMKMPKGCGYCVFNQPFAKGRYCCLCGFPIFEIGDERLDNCPMIELPPHGRLIDATELIERFQISAELEWNKHVCTSASNMYYEAIDVIDNAPTVIPATRKENKDGLYSD